MADSMSAAERRRRLEECAAVLRKIADGKQLGDGTKETWVCGIASGLLLEQSDLRERCTCIECRHRERVNDRIVESRCCLTGISFLKYGVERAPIDPKTFYCKFAEERGVGR